jgi:protein SCO1/2
MAPRIRHDRTHGCGVMPEARLGGIIQGKGLHKPELKQLQFEPKSDVVQPQRIPPLDEPADAAIATTGFVERCVSVNRKLSENRQKRPPVMDRRLLFVVAVVVVGLAALAMAAFVALRDADAPAASSIGGPFTLTGSNGKTVTQKDFAGAPTLIFFGYTHCPDVCPATLFEMSEALRALGPDRKAAALFITVDPERDTPEVLKDYLSSFDPRIIGVTGSREQVDPVLKGFRVYSRKISGEGDDYTMDHTALVYLMDKQWRFVRPFRLDRKPQEVAAELSKYL